MPSIRRSRSMGALLTLAALLLALALPPIAIAQDGPPDGVARFHYQRDDADYAGWVLHLWEDTLEQVTWAQGLPITGFDEYGAYWDVRLTEDAARVGFIVHKGDIKDPGPDMFLVLGQHGRQVWLVSGSDRILTAPPLAPPAEDVARVHYTRPDGDYDGWVLHVWEDTSADVTWDAGLRISGESGYGVYWDVPLIEGATRVGFIVHKGDDKDPGPDMFLDLAQGNEVWLVSGSATIFREPPDVRVGGGDLRSRRAHWLRTDVLAWDVGLVTPGQTFALYGTTTGLTLGDGGVEGAPAVELSIDDDGLPADVLRQFPHLAGHTALRLPAEARAWVPALLRGELAIATYRDGRLVDASGLQIAGVLDDRYATDAPLGVTWDGDVPSIAVWAPTARSVALQRFETSSGPLVETVPMRRDDATGVWSIVGAPEWRWSFYLFEVDVFVPSTGRFETNLVTDPYSLSLAMNSARSQVVDLRDPALAPPGWDAFVKPPLADPVDAVVYELHVRDFSVADPLVPDALRGTYAAFTLEGTYGLEHLRRLSDAGLTHLHLLPTFDIATIDEDRGTWLEPEIDEALPTASPRPQAAVEAVRDRDGFNWGYDPWHYNVPEGSYATDPDGPARILEFREMVVALWEGAGLRLVVDVVYNHTNAAGQGQRSVLDRIVPGYYHRLDDGGNVTTSTCCPNTATEHAMMERLMLDSVAVWAEQYKVDAFRFDLMGHHMVRNMQAVRAVLDALTPAEHGVYGSGVYVYGEGWDFGEVAQGARGPNATQRTMAGSGIGTFNDRLRDAVRGGGPFDGGEAIVANQGFASGAFVLPNDVTARMGAEARLATALLAADQIRVGLAANLEHITFVDRTGALATGRDVDYNGQSAGYGRVPQDHVVYVSKHDNQTLWDILQYKLPRDLGTDDRVRLQNLALSTVLFAQGVPFVHAGSELLRSKSFDRNSYDSGDWFNAIDWTMQTNGMGRGLPLAADNRDNWALMRDRLVDPLLHPSSDHIAFAADVFTEWLRIRADTPLLRLRTSEDVLARLRFHDTGPDQTPGVIVMSLHDDDVETALLDERYASLVIVWNAGPDVVRVDAPALAGVPYLLHPVQAEGVDAGTLYGSYVATASGQVRVPGFSTVVFVAPRLP
jgi:pullulanase